MKTFTFVLLALLGSILVYMTGDFPAVGDVHSPPNSRVSPYFLTHAIHDTHAPNVVSAVLGDYRGFDTMLETAVVVAGGLAILLILFAPWGTHNDRALVVGDESTQMVLKVTTNLLIPPIQLFALYVLIHGHYSPGGGFQGGVIFGATFILHAIAFGLGATYDRMRKSWVVSYAYFGVLLYATVGVGALLLGHNFLDYSSYASIFGIKPAIARSFGILVIETGVAMSVATVMFTIYAALVSRGTFRGRTDDA